MSTTVGGLELTVAELGRNVEDLKKTREKYVPMIEHMAKADEIADAVAKELKRRGPVVPIHWAWKLAALLVALVTVAGGVKGLIG